MSENIHLKNKHTIILGILSIFGILITFLAFTHAVIFKTPKVSVIIPVYNTEKYLEECLNSVENQTLKDIEIICVNDGSTDKSLEILNNHANKDSRIKVISQENGGVSHARNTGIENSRGDYIAFIDSDDLIVPHAYETMYYNALRYNVDMVNSRFSYFSDGESIDVNSFVYDKSKVKKIDREKSENPFYAFPDSGYVWNKLYKRSAIAENQLKFKEGVTNYEDGLFNFFVFPKVMSIVQDENVFYCYSSSRPGSSSANNISKIMKSGLTVASELVNNNDKFDFTNSNEWIVAKCLDVNYYHIVNSAKNTPEIQKEYAKEFLKTVNDNYILKYDYEYPKWIYNQIEDLKKLAE